MNNIFFGKISKKFDIEQIEKGYYKAGKDSGWFGELQLGDYVYLIGGNKIQLWQAKNWSATNDCLFFDIINKDLGIGVNQFIALNFFKLTKALIVLTSRSARQRAFFKLDIVKEYNINELSDTNFYLDPILYRNIVITDKNNIIPDSQDIQISYDDAKLSLYHASFFSSEVYNSFQDNLNRLGGGSKRKDNTIKIIEKAIEGKQVKLSHNDLGLRSFYDAFFCDYKDKDIEYEIEEDIESVLPTSIMENLLKLKKNLIIQGAPGTGKTYHTAEIAVALCNGVSTIKESRANIMNTYKSLIKQGRIMFSTFHQSMDYEEFVEGLKPECTTDTVTYSIKPGLFKQICEKAKAPIIINNNLGIRNNPTIWKVSLQGTYDNDVRTDCLLNNRIRIGWDLYGENIEDDFTYPNGGKGILDTFINKMQIGDIVMSCYTQTTVDAIGVIIGEYEWDNQLDEYKRLRKVNWLIKGVKENIYELNNNTVMTLSTVYRMNHLSMEAVMSILDKHKAVQTESIHKNTEPHILIIDEINRGNISKIFGELITLLEVDKRADEDNEIRAVLSYSNQEFSVPSNLYIIGTMNTTDRSVGNIDYAIRRRFAFYTLKANKDAIESYYDTTKNIEDDTKGIALNLFDTIRKFVEANKSPEFDVDDIMIGHSYFMAKDKISLRMKLEYEIIPLLKEYEKDGIMTRKPDTEEWTTLFQKTK